MDSDGVGKKSTITCTNQKKPNKPTGSMERLPRDIFFDILSRLPITSLVQCKFVCRLWQSSVEDPLLANMHLSHTAENNLCLVFHSDYPYAISIRNQLRVLHIGAPDKYKETIKKINTPFEPLIPEFDVVGSCNGLLCLSNSLFDDPVYVYNPFTKEYRELPKFTECLDQNVFKVVFGFGFLPTTKEYKVIRIVYYKEGSNVLLKGVPNRKSEVFVFSLGTDAWRNTGKIPHQLNGPMSEALVNGKLHWLTYCLGLGKVQYRDIISFDLATEEFRDIPRPDCEGLNRCNYHLVELRGCLSAVVSCGGGTNEVWMMKDYNVKESWTKEFIIGNYVPRGLKREVIPPSRVWKNGFDRRGVRILCILKNGEILYLYHSRTLVSFCTNHKKFKDLKFDGLPNDFHAIVHLGSLISIDAANIHRQR